MKRSLILLYGITNYALGSAALAYLIGFVLNLFPDHPYLVNIDHASDTNMLLSLTINIGLIALFGLQHSIMARPAFKRWLTRYLPEPAERSTFMLATAIVCFTVVALWQPLPSIIWSVEDPALYMILLAISLIGWTLVLYSTFLINHFDLFGLRQVWLYFTGKQYTHLPFQLNSLYRYVRHPIMTGVFIGIWFTPLMTVGHLIFAIGMSIYILIGVYHEEKDLVKLFGTRYSNYRMQTARFFPNILKRKSADIDTLTGNT